VDDNRSAAPLAAGAALLATLTGARAVAGAGALAEARPPGAGLARRVSTAVPTCLRRDQCRDLRLDGHPGGLAAAGGLDERVAGLDLDRGDVESCRRDHPLHRASLVRQREGDDGAELAGPGRPAGAVQVVLVVRRRVHLEHEGDVVDVDTA